MDVYQKIELLIKLHEQSRSSGFNSETLMKIGLRLGEDILNDFANKKHTLLADAFGLNKNG